MVILTRSKMTEKINFQRMRKELIDIPTRYQGPKLTRILKKRGVVKADVFGSTARGTAKKKSDVDILVTFKGNKSLLDLVSLKQELEATFKKPFDVLTHKSVHPFLKEKIRKSGIVT